MMPIDPDSIRIAVDRPEATYRCGETAVFTVSLAEDIGDARCDAIVTLDNFGAIEYSRRSVDLAADCPFTVEGTMQEPGFLRLCVQPTGSDKRKIFGVGFEPENIRKASPSPSDFDDDACVPCAVYATWNEMTSPDREIIPGIGMGHNCCTRPDIMEKVNAWLRKP